MDILKSKFSCCQTFSTVRPWNEAETHGEHILFGEWHCNTRHINTHVAFPVTSPKKGNGQSVKMKTKFSSICIWYMYVHCTCSIFEFMFVHSWNIHQVIKCCHNCSSRRLRDPAPSWQLRPAGFQTSRTTTHKPQTHWRLDTLLLSWTILLPECHYNLLPKELLPIANQHWIWRATWRSLLFRCCWMLFNHNDITRCFVSALTGWDLWATARLAPTGLAPEWFPPEPFSPAGHKSSLQGLLKQPSCLQMDLDWF